MSARDESASNESMSFVGGRELREPGQAAALAVVSSDLLRGRREDYGRRRSATAPESSGGVVAGRGVVAPAIDHVLRLGPYVLNSQRFPVPTGAGLAGCHGFAHKVALP